MKDSAGALRGLNAQAGTVEDVQNALESLKEEMGKVDDVGSAVAEAGQEVNVADENEIDEEFDALLRQKEKAEEEEEVEEAKQKLAELQTEDNIQANGAKKPTSSSIDNQPMTSRATSNSTSSKDIVTPGNMSLEGEKASSRDSIPESQKRTESADAIMET
ncbi:MAG: hypothetical protein Q9169_003278 [Polycauliona sp. 2 TL-2023]